MAPDKDPEFTAIHETSNEQELLSAGPGSKIDENYEVLASVGEGGMGSVVKARHRLLGQEVAIKRIRDNKSADEAARNRFINEAKAASRLKHVNLAGVREFGIDHDGSPYAIMDFIDGADLSTIIKEGKIQNDPRRVLEIAAQVAAGLEHAHKMGVVHRDIKPSNIIISANDEKTERATIVDFGIAKITETDGQRLTQTGEIFGSPFYLSPEQAIGKVVDQRSDIYSLACVIYECLTGTPPFVGENPMQTAMKHLNEEIPSLSKNCKVPLPDGLAELVQTCLQKDPENRYKTAAELEAELRAILEGRGSRSRKKAQSWKKSAGLLLVSCMLLLGLLAVFTSSKQLPRSETGFDNLPISKLARVALDVDMQRAKGEFDSGAFEKSAHSLLSSNLILSKEIKELDKKITAAKNRKERRELSQAKTTVLEYYNQNLVHIGMCYLKSNDLSEARTYLEEALPYYQDYVERWAKHIQKTKAAPPPLESNGQKNPVIEIYEYYIQILQDLGDSSRLGEIEAEYAAARRKLSWGSGYLIINRPWNISSDSQSAQ